MGRTPTNSLSPAPSGGEGRGEGVLVFTESSFPNRKSLLSPALSSLGGRRGSSSFAIRGQCPTALPQFPAVLRPIAVLTSLPWMTLIGR